MKMKIFILFFCGFWIFYICNADWIDDLIEDYLGCDYEEVAPFISSVTAGTEEFDRLVEELSRSKNKWFLSSLTLLSLLGALTVSVWFYERAFLSRGRVLVKAGARILTRCNHFRNATGGNKEEIQNLVTEFIEKKLKHFYGSNKGDDVPVKLLWKSGSLMESSVHCNVKEDSKIHQMLLRSKFSFGFPENENGSKKLKLSPSASEDLTAKKMADIRKLLESEQEIKHEVQKTNGTDEGSTDTPQTGKAELRPNACARRRPGSSPNTERFPEEEKSTTIENKVQNKERDNTGDGKPNQDGSPDPKLMNRIRLLESRLRLEELKNKNWIDRMSKAEGILQQLNKQVELIEETRPMETLTKTLKITSTVTNWAPSSQPRRNMQFTLVNQYPAFYLQNPYTSLSDVIKKEIGIPSSGDCTKALQQIPPTPPIPALPSPSILPHSSFLSKFLSR